MNALKAKADIAGPMGLIVMTYLRTALKETFLDAWAGKVQINLNKKQREFTISRFR